MRPKIDKPVQASHWTDKIVSVCGSDDENRFIGIRLLFEMLTY